MQFSQTLFAALHRSCLGVAGPWRPLKILKILFSISSSLSPSLSLSLSLSVSLCLSLSLSLSLCLFASLSLLSVCYMFRLIITSHVCLAPPKFFHPRAPRIHPPAYPRPWSVGGLSVSISRVGSSFKPAWRPDLPCNTPLSPRLRRRNPHQKSTKFS